MSKPVLVTALVSTDDGKVYEVLLTDDHRDMLFNLLTVMGGGRIKCLDKPLSGVTLERSAVSSASGDAK